MRKIVLFMILWLVACTSTPETISPEMINTAIAQTQLAQSKEIMPSEPIEPPASDITNTPHPTSTNQPTRTPRPTSIPRPTSTPSLGTINFPYPFMDEVNLIQNDEAEFSIQIVELIRGEEAFRIILRANQFNEEPPQGMEYVLIKIKIKMTGGSGIVEMSDFDIVSISGGQIFDSFSYSPCCLENVNYHELDANLISIGAETEGWIARPVFSDDQIPMIAIGIDSFMPDIKNGLFFALTP